MMANDQSRPIGPTLPRWGVAVLPRLSTQGFALGSFRLHLWCNQGADGQLRAFAQRCGVFTIPRL